MERDGRSLIRVSDDGCGMQRDDALLSIERYATSKIADEKDHFSMVREEDSVQLGKATQGTPRQEGLWQKRRFGDLRVVDQLCRLG